MKRGFCGREDLTPRKACPAAGGRLLQAARQAFCPAKSNSRKREGLAAAQCSALTFLGASSHASRAGLVGDKPEELGVLQSKAAD